MQTLVGRLDLATALPAAFEPFLASTRIVLEDCTLTILAVELTRRAPTHACIILGTSTRRSCPEASHVQS